MKLAVQILLFVFVSFLITPTVVSVIKKDAPTSAFFNFAEEEKAQKEIKAVFNDEVESLPQHFPNLTSSLILSENLSRHDKIASKIFIPPPEQI